MGCDFLGELCWRTSLRPSASGADGARFAAVERRTAERLEQKLDDDYLVWYDVPVGPKHAHPDFVVLHPRRGLLILEVKDWRLETIRAASKQTWEILAQGVPKSVPNPIVQARHYAHQVVDALARDQRLTNADGKLAFPATASSSRTSRASSSRPPS